MIKGDDWWYGLLAFCTVLVVTRFLGLWMIENVVPWIEWWAE